MDLHNHIYEREQFMSYEEEIVCMWERERFRRKDSNRWEKVSISWDSFKVSSKPSNKYQVLSSIYVYIPALMSRTVCCSSERTSVPRCRYAARASWYCTRGAMEPLFSVAWFCVELLACSIAFVVSSYIYIYIDTYSIWDVLSWLPGWERERERASERVNQ